MTIPVILAHRGNLNGSNRETANTVGAYRQALEFGFGLEIDVRRSFSNEFYISHDQVSEYSNILLEVYEPHFRTYSKMPIAVNVKELGYEAKLASQLLAGAFGDRAFLFDFELLEPLVPGRAQRLLRATDACANVPMASRLSDRNEPMQQALSIPAEITWADEFDSLWLSEAHVNAVHEAGRRFYVISPELHGFSRDERLSRWEDFARWRVDGICTDFALEARSFFDSQTQSKL